MRTPEPPGRWRLRPHRQGADGDAGRGARLRAPCPLAPPARLARGGGGRPHRRAATRAALAEARDVTHLFYAALAPQPNPRTKPG